MDLSGRSLDEVKRNRELSFSSSFTISHSIDQALGVIAAKVASNIYDDGANRQVFAATSGEYGTNF